MSTHQADPEIRIPNKTKDECNILATLRNPKRINGEPPKYLEFKDCDGNAIKASCAAEGKSNLNKPDRSISGMKIFKNIDVLEITCNNKVGPPFSFISLCLVLKFTYKEPFELFQAGIVIGAALTVEILLNRLAIEIRKYIDVSLHSFYLFTQVWRLIFKSYSHLLLQYVRHVKLLNEEIERVNKRKSGGSEENKVPEKSEGQKKNEKESKIDDVKIWGIREKSFKKWEVFLSKVDKVDKVESPVPRPEYVSLQDLILNPKLYRPHGQVDTDLNSTPNVDKATRKKRKNIEDTTEEVHVEKGKAPRNNKGRKKVRFENL